MSRRVDPPSPQTALRELRRDVGRLQRTPGRWIYVGNFPSDTGTTSESPPFENGWSNSGGDAPLCSFYVDKWRRVHIRGGVSGGAVGSVIFTLPSQYRPPQSERLVCAGSGTTPVTIQVDPSGAVTLIG